MKSDYDKDKFEMDEYGNLIPKSTPKSTSKDKWLDECKNKLDNTTNVKLPKNYNA